MEKLPDEDPVTKSEALSQLPASFKKFLQDNGVDPDFFYGDSDLENLPRYIRVNPLKNVSLEEVQADLGTAPTPIEWLPNVYRLPADVKISHTQAYKNGEIYGLDLSSCAVVLAMDPKENEHILDLCCSPGTKLCFIADLIKKSSKEVKGSVVGVDINEHRLNVCRSLVNKYGHSDLVKLYCEDGTTFKKTPKENELYDKILVDAECTHDGSIKHLFKFCKTKEQETVPATEEVKESEPQPQAQEQTSENYKPMSNKERKRREKQKLEHLERLEKKKIKLNNNEWSVENFEDRVLNEDKLKNITTLQKNLVINAFSLLKPKGILVYSTCSFIRAQNEDVVKFIVEECPETRGKIEVIDVFDPQVRSKIPCREGSYAKTVRFDPKTSNTGGMFISKMQKL